MFQNAQEHKEPYREDGGEDGRRREACNVFPRLVFKEHVHMHVHRKDLKGKREESSESGELSMPKGGLPGIHLLHFLKTGISSRVKVISCIFYLPKS